MFWSVRERAKEQVQIFDGRRFVFSYTPPARKVGERISRGARVVRTERTDEASINSEYVTEIRETNVHMYARVKQKKKPTPT